MLSIGQPVLEMVVQVTVDPDATALVPVELVRIDLPAFVIQGTLEATSLMVDAVTVPEWQRTSEEFFGIVVAPTGHRFCIQGWRWGRPGSQPGCRSQQATANGLQPGPAIMTDVAGHDTVRTRSDWCCRSLDEKFIDGSARVDDKPWSAGGIDVGGLERNFQVPVNGRCDIRGTHFLRCDAAPLAVGAANRATV